MAITPSSNPFGIGAGNASAVGQHGHGTGEVTGFPVRARSHGGYPSAGQPRSHSHTGSTHGMSGPPLGISGSRYGSGAVFQQQSLSPTAAGRSGSRRQVRSHDRD